MTITAMSSNEPTTAPLGYQMDVAILDEYLHSLLWTQFVTSLDPLLQADNDNETTNDLPRILRMLLASLLPAATIWITQTQTPATKALGLRTVMTSTNSNPRTTLHKYIVLTAILPLLYHALQRLLWKLQQELVRLDHDTRLTDQEEEIAYTQTKTAKQRQFAIAKAIVQLVELGLPLGKLGLLLSLLWKPTSSTSTITGLPTPQSPRLAMVLAGLGFLRVHPPDSNHHSQAHNSSIASPPRLYVLYAHRRWLYEESLQTLKMVFAPLLNSFQEARQFVESW
jgi:hypothetical protein